MSKQKKVRNLILLLVALLGITILQDYLQSGYQDHAFYFSESLLFNLFWPLIIPVTLILSSTFKHVKTLSKWTKRALFVLLATIFHLLLFAFLVFAVSGLFYDHTFGFFGNLVYSLSHDLYKYLLIYTAISLIPTQKLPDTKIQKSGEYPDFLLLQSGKRTEKIPTESILFTASATPYVEFFTAEKKYLQHGSLKSFSEKLNPSVFVRIHKTTLVNVSKVDSISSRGNGDYDLLLSNGQALRLSRNYVPDFRSRFEQAPTG
ncbi:LytR/AlgR family response regulator transcription factor [Algoriphagus terrigena]|uniref:LytR/AlgR family response regulator transcription factor n=1 Tax=Algoriphagus terrigena TaxID=344884 RepID=UPI0004021270|nr:LytTR family DNA-binding domain-containing protein [Algoriphagus terrigena]